MQELISLMDQEIKERLEIVNKNLAEIQVIQKNVKTINRLMREINGDKNKTSTKRKTTKR